MKNLFKILWKVFAVAALCVLVFLFLQIMGEAQSVIDSYEQLTGNSIGATNSIKIAFLREYVQHTGKTDILFTVGVTQAEADLIIKDDLLPEESAGGEDDRQNSTGNEANSGNESGTTPEPGTSPDPSNPSPAPPSITVPTDVESLKNMLLACGIFNNAGDANCNKVFQILYPSTTETYTSLKSWSTTTENKIKQLNSNELTKVQVNVWKFKNYSRNSTDLTKVSSTLSIECSKTIAPLVTQIFSEIYASPEQPVIMTAGGLSVRCMNNGKGGSTTSTHSYGGTIDVNAYVGEKIEWNYNGPKGGSTTNPYPPSKANWDKLPENQYKYLCIYEGSTIMTTFEKYGFYWGGRWKNGTCDPMHFSVFGH